MTGRATLVTLVPDVVQVVRFVRLLKVVTEVAPMTMLPLVWLPCVTLVVVRCSMPKSLIRPTLTAW